MATNDGVEPPEEDVVRKVVPTVFNTEDRPATLFANQIHTIGMNQFVVLNFYSAVPPTAELPPEMEASMVAQIVVPQEAWVELTDNAYRQRHPSDPDAGDGDEEAPQ